MTDKNIPPRRTRAPGQRDELVTITVPLETITPILGGAAEPRTLDEHDPIRVPGIRGQLRFWWRALHGHGKTAKELAREEAAIWGGVHGGEPKRSRIAVWIANVAVQVDDRDDSAPHGPELYALWPAAENKSKGLDPAPRWHPGLRFELALRFPDALRGPLERTLRAWILFGGIGSRTRRGCGSLTVQEHARKTWLPGNFSLAALHELLGNHVFLASTSQANDMPLLHAATLLGGARPRDDRTAWREALGWLRDFRQKPGDAPGQFAREPVRIVRRANGKPIERPGRSRWPEPDKVRHVLAAGHSRHPGWAHSPVHNEKPVWPRASFGLPINGRFQDKDIAGDRYDPPDPRDFELRWQNRSGSHDRLASPLILKALPLADGRCMPIALWLQREYPEDGEVVLWRNKAPVKGSAARFDRLRADGDTVLYKPLEKARGMKDAFVTWLVTERKLTRLGGDDL